MLHEVAADAAAPPPDRAPTRACSRRTRAGGGATSTARARASPRLGYVGNWMLVGPVRQRRQGRPRRGVRPREGAGAAAQPHARLRRQGPQAGSLAAAARRCRPTAGSTSASFVRPAEQACVYATTFVRDARVKERARRAPVSVWAGAAGAMRVFWNGVEILRDDKYRDLDPDRFAATATLREGWNRLTAKVCGDERAPMLSLRVAGADGAPDERPRGRRRPAPLDARRAAPCWPLGKGGARRRGRPSRGPLQAFERLAKGDDPGDARGVRALPRRDRLGRPDASTAPASSRARRPRRRRRSRASCSPASSPRAATSAPSWIDKAEALVATGARRRRSETIEVLLARAAYARGGRQLARRDPVLRARPRARPGQRAGDAREGRALRGGGPARHGARAARSGRSRAGRAAWRLLRATVAALRDEGRETEADEMAERYAALRFDDPAFARARIELAVARRDEATAARWIDRLLATNPDSAGALAGRGAGVDRASGERRARHRGVPSGARPRARRHRHDAPARDASTRWRGSATSSFASSSACSSSCRRRRTCATRSRTSSRRPRARRAVRAPRERVPREARGAGRTVRRGGRSSTCR